MKETVLTIEDAARCLPELVERIRMSGKGAVLVKAGQPLARIVPLAPAEQGTADLIAFLHRWRTEHPEPDEQLADAIDASHRAIRPPHDPWE